ncbi:DUF4412 domain-containing protein [Reichenbachiella carrageenanivorans]|uniref:DUF4412 domain-containing protein n=1 Tax=Reichenbachiella carrageenanivorans TaxID=2979869 RepID=A0ABY6D0B7_9BACT|nr:DUF4412 domain-containing protein [Reichenbachiella carrageenanivorans]UXX79619.1 DUF4412 domain-containing protein [Reichenbachiella carrageenanivorans]
MIALKKLSLIGLMLCLTLTVWAEDGIFILSKTKTLDNGKVATSEIYLTADKMLVKNSGADNSSIIFNSTTEVFTFVDNNKKEYYQFDKATLQQLQEQIKMMAKMMKQFAANIPAEQKEKFDKILNPQTGDLLSYKANGKNDKIGTWKTVGYDGMNGEQKALQMNIASFDGLGVKSDDFAVMKKMMSYFKENLQEVVALLPTGGSMAQLNFDDSSPVLKDGIPVKTISYEGGSPENENLVEVLEKKSIAADQFKVPAGYKEKEINMQSMGR